MSARHIAWLNGNKHIRPPPDFGWPFATYPVNIAGSFGNFSTNINPRSLINPALWATTSVIYVDIATGNDTTAAVVALGDTSKPAQGMGKAIALGNATAGPYRVFVKSGLYTRSLGAPGREAVWPNQPCSFEAYGGRVKFGNFDILAWTHDGTQTNCYTAPRSNVNRVFDILNQTSDGYYTELTLVADAATCNSTPNSWTFASPSLYVHRADGVAVTNANTRAILGAGLETFRAPAAADLYISGMDIEGGATGCLHSLNATGNIVAEDCTFRYSGSIALPIDCVQIDSLIGIVAFFRCDASQSSKDGFNFHFNTTPGGARITYVLTVNCTGRGNGRGTSTSNNGLTMHENLIGIDISGDYESNYGGNVHHVGTTQAWCVGTVSRNSLGDIPLGGTYESAGFRLDQGVNQMWLDSCLAEGNLYPVDSLGVSSAIYLRNSRLAGGQNRATGTIAAY